MNKSAALILLAGAGLAAACSRRPSAVPAAPRTDEAPRWPSQAASPRLPEDPAAGKRAEEQWKGHLAAEDRDRQLARDRHALADHQAIVALLVKARREPVAGLEPQVERHLARINVWGNVSPLTAVYRSMVARLHKATGPEWDLQMGAIRSYLQAAAESEGEGD
jgi:hypothetical protein